MVCYGADLRKKSAGCQMAGFLTVFSSELSIFTLTVITLERWYAITYAIHLNRRLHLGTAAKVMILGWLYALVMAALPIFGISSYNRTSICLPMDNTDLPDLAYIICLLSAKGAAFLLICVCYAKMYLSIRVSSNSGNRDTPDLHANRAVRSDLSVAKRMAMLVFTDFACWAPIAFFGLTAVAGAPLIDVTNSKILLVFFYPLNSCSNPFLYAILTKQYRRDVMALLARIGMCRRRSSCVHGRTLSTNTHQQQRQISSVKALYRNSLGMPGNQRQVVLPSSARRLPGMTQYDTMTNDFYIHGQRSPAHYSGNISREDNLVPLHFEYDQARRRFVEWAQNEIAVVPDFHKRILFSDEAHFWLNGYVNKQNCRIWSEANPQVYVETPLHPEKLTVWCALWAGGILLQKR
ncbi:thyrotropin receptor [Trichonephila clavipes]|nr:thyrotropin receptor [Trichonephila clavipes]